MCQVFYCVNGIFGVFMRVLILCMLLAVCGCSLTTQTDDKPILFMDPPDVFPELRLEQMAVAARHGDVTEIKSLIAQGVDVNGRGKYGVTPIFFAWQAGSLAAYKYLLEHGANPEVIWDDGDSFLNVVAEYSTNPIFLELALDHGANVNLMSPRSGETPLLAAAGTSNKTNIPTLLAHGANINQQTSVSKQTPLMEALVLNQFDTAYKLLEAGADLHLKDDSGWDVRDYLQLAYTGSLSDEGFRARQPIVEFLKAHNFWEKIRRPEDFKRSKYSLAPGETYVLSWSSVAGADYYNLMLNGVVDETPITRLYVDEKAPDLKDAEQHLYWRLRACNAKECSAWSVFAEVRVKK